MTSVDPDKVRRLLKQRWHRQRKKGWVKYRWVCVLIVVMYGVIFAVSRLANLLHLPDWAEVLSVVICMLPFAVCSLMLLKMAEVELSHAEGLKRDEEKFIDVSAFLKNGKPFVQYLRNSSGEQEFESVSTPSGSQHIYHSKCEARILDPLAKLSSVPPVALGNWDETAITHSACRLWSSEAEWFEIVKTLAVKSCLIILDVTEPSPGILKEIDWIRDNATQKTFLVVTPSGLEKLNSVRPGFVDSVAWKVVQERLRVTLIGAHFIPVAIPDRVIARLNDCLANKVE